MKTGEAHTLVFTVTDGEKFKKFWNEIFYRKPEDLPTMTEKFGCYAHCSSCGDMSETVSKHEKALDYWSEHRNDFNVEANVAEPLTCNLTPLSVVVPIRTLPPLSNIALFPKLPVPVNFGM